MSWLALIRAYGLDPSFLEQTARDMRLSASLSSSLITTPYLSSHCTLMAILARKGVAVLTLCFTQRLYQACIIPGRNPNKVRRMLISRVCWQPYFIATGSGGRMMAKKLHINRWNVFFPRITYQAWRIPGRTPNKKSTTLIPTFVEHSASLIKTATVADNQC